MILKVEAAAHVETGWLAARQYSDQIPQNHGHLVDTELMLAE